MPSNVRCTGTKHFECEHVLKEKYVSLERRKAFSIHKKNTSPKVNTKLYFLDCWTPSGNNICSRQTFVMVIELFIYTIGNNFKHNLTANNCKQRYVNGKKIG